MSTDEDTRIQGEGDYESAESYNRDKTDFVESGKAEKAAEKLTGESQPGDKAAHDKAAGRAKEHDPRETEDFGKAS